MVMFIDMDGLKMINDTYGHKSGDIAIRSMATILHECCTNGEICCRFGGANSLSLPQIIPSRMRIG